jgi:dihydroxyacid dehydratase/phosphogluconate dehydratase
MLRAVGFTDTDFEKPIVDVANAYSTITPCNISLNIPAGVEFSSIAKTRIAVVVIAFA